MQLSITHARRCLLHMHAGVYDTCTQVSMIFACRCLLHLLAGHHSSEGNSDRYAVVYCTQVSMTTARRCLWHLHADPHNTHFHDYLIHSEDDDHNDSILSFLYICLSLACRSKLSFCTYLPSSTTDWVSCLGPKNLVERSTQPVVPLYCHLIPFVCLSSNNPDNP